MCRCAFGMRVQHTGRVLWRKRPDRTIAKNHAKVAFGIACGRATTKHCLSKFTNVLSFQKGIMTFCRVGQLST